MKETHSKPHTHTHTHTHTRKVSLSPSVSHSRSLLLARLHTPTHTYTLSPGVVSPHTGLGKDTEKDDRGGEKASGWVKNESRGGVMRWDHSAEPPRGYLAD